MKKLHEVIIDTLWMNGNQGMTAREIAKAINRDRLWLRPSDSTPPPPNQINARVSHRRYKHLFTKDGEGRIYIA